MQINRRPNGWGLIAHLSAECWAQDRTKHQYPPRRNWALRPSQMPIWGFGSCGGKTAAHIGSLVHNEVYELLRADKAHQLKEQALVARAAYNLGQLSACMTTSEERKERKSAIKRELVQSLVDAGVRLTDVQTIMNNMLKGCAMNNRMNVDKQGNLHIDPNGTLFDFNIHQQICAQYILKIQQLEAKTTEIAQCEEVKKLQDKMVEKDKELIKLRTIIDSAASILEY